MNNMEAPIAAPYEALLKILFFLDFIRARTLIVRTLEAPHLNVDRARRFLVVPATTLGNFLFRSGPQLPTYYSFPRYTSIASRGYAFSGLCKSFGEAKAGN